MLHPYYVRTLCFRTNCSHKIVHTEHRYDVFRDRQLTCECRTAPVAPGSTPSAGRWAGRDVGPGRLPLPAAAVVVVVVVVAAATDSAT